MMKDAAVHTLLHTKGAGTAIVGGSVSVLGLAINEWMSIVGGICALIGATVAVLNYRSASRVHQAQLAYIKRRPNDA